MPARAEATTHRDHALTAFRALVLSDVALQDALGQIEDFAVFVTQAAEAARGRGVDLDAETLRARLHAPVADLVVPDGLPPLPGWLPAEVSRVDDRDVVTWLHFGRRRLTEPFYGDDLVKARWRPLNRLLSFRTPLLDLEAWASALPAIEPAGLVFHMSRCGSTLVAQMLAAPPRHVVLSEPAPLDAIVRLDDHDAAAKAVLLRAMVTVLGQARNPGEDRCFLKLDCWHTLSLPLFRRAFPDARWVFLYRDPVEVMVSHGRRRGAQMVPSLVAPAMFGIDLPGGVPNDDYCARVLAAVCEGAMQHIPEGGALMVNYPQLPEALFTTVLPHFGLAVSRDEADAMRCAAVRDAKAPEQAFSADGQGKQQAASEAVRAICEVRLGEVYRRLEALREEQA